MRLLNSLRARLIIPVILISLTLLTVTIIFMGQRQLRDVRQNAIGQARANLQMIADYASVPLIFDQREDAKDVLSKVKNIRSVLSAVIYSIDEKLFVSYGADSVMQNLQPEFFDKEIKFSEKSMFITVPIIHRDVKYGTLVAKIDLRAQQRLIRELSGLFLMVFAAMGILAILLTFFFERKFLKPILLLTQKFREISRTTSLVKPMKPLSVDQRASNEIEILISGYNKMVATLTLREKKQSEAEAALKDINEKLETKVAERTEELRLAKEKAEESDRLKSAFLANMSHEIRTPLNAIVGFTSMLVSEDFDQETKNNYIRIVEDNTENLLNLIEDILDLSKLESGTLNISPNEVDMMSFSQDIYKNSLMMRGRMNKQNCEMMMNIQSLPVGEKGFFDRLRIQQVILNLINNALKFTEEGFITFGIELRKKKFLFYVKDTGSGIDDKDKKHVFDRFYKSRDSKRLYKGTGLGLAICKSLVELSEGKIWLKTELGKGTAFYFTLPRHS